MCEGHIGGQRKGGGEKSDTKQMCEQLGRELSAGEQRENEEKAVPLPREASSRHLLACPASCHHPDENQLALHTLPSSRGFSRGRAPGNVMPESHEGCRRESMVVLTGLACPDLLPNRARGHLGSF